MIYLFNKKKELQRIVPRKHLISAIQIVERNGVYQLTAEMPSFYVDKDKRETNYKKLVEDASFIGHYDLQKRFQIYKIYGTNLTADNRGERLIVDAVHIFFDEAKALGNIHDRRFRDSEAKAAADVAFNAIGWQVTDYDVTDRHDINFYRDSVTNAWNKLIETFGVEFDYEVIFDGQKIVSKNVIMKKAIGRWTGERFAYGTNILSLTQEQDESEIYTAAVGRGRGEEAGDGYGPRLEFGDIEWSKDGIQKPIGQNWIEIPTATLEYGFYENGEIKPRIAPEVVFENIENPVELANVTYQWLLENCVPKATWTTDVAKVGNLNLGDGVGIIYKRAGIVKQARVEKIEHNLLDPSLSKITLGDFKHFKNRQMKRINSQIKRANRDARSLITQLEEAFDAQFEAEKIAFRNLFEQFKIDILAESEADRIRMEAEFNQALNDWTEAFNEDVAEAYRQAEENYARIEQEITTAVDTTRNELEQGYTDAVEQAKQYAEQQSKAHADAVESKLNEVTGSHQGLIESLQNDITDIDAFLGNRTEPLEQTLQNMKLEWEQKLDNVDTWHYNMLRGTRFDEPNRIKMYRGSIKTDEEIPYFEYNTEPHQGWVEFLDEIQFEAGQQYTLSFDVQTLGVKKMDYTFIIASPNDAVGTNMQIHRADVQDSGTNNNIFLFAQYRRYWIKFTPDRNILGTIRIGANLINNERGYQPFKIRLPYLTTTDNTRWLYHQLDSTQNIEEITRRVMQLEDGYEEFVTKTQYNYDTGQIDGRIKHVTSTVDGFEQTINNHENWILTNGASIEHTVDGFESKAWLSDIDNPNLIPHASVHIDNHRLQWDRNLASTTGQSYQDWMQVTHATSPRSYLAVYSPEFSTVAGETYTLSFESWENGNDSSNTTGNMSYTFLTYRDSTNQSIWSSLKRKKIGTINGADIYSNEVTFTSNATSDTARMLIGTKVVNIGQHSTFRFRNPKLEVGSRATPFNNAFTGITQRADEIYLMYQGLGEEGFVTQSQIKLDGKGVQIGSTYVDGSSIGSILAVSPTGIDAVAKQMRLSGDLFVKGDITAIAVEAIEGRFSSLFASNLTANIIKGTHIDSKTITSDHIVVNDALVNLLVARSVFADDITAKIGNFIDINAGRVRTAILESNVITADHLAVGTTMVDKIFGTSGRIDQLIGKDYFIQNIKALSIEAVEGRFSTLATKYFEANYIDVDWINGLNAWFERMYVDNAMISKLTSQSVFARDVRAISIEAFELNLTTIMNSMGQVEGGLSIRRPDGGIVIDQGMQKFGSPVITKPFPGAEVEYEIPNYVTLSRGTQTFERAYGEHSGRWMNIGFALSLRWDSDHASSFVGVTVRPQNLPAGVNIPEQTEQFIAYRDSGTRSYAMRVRLPVPTFGAMSYTLEFHRVGDAGSRNYVQIRSERCWVSN